MSKPKFAVGDLVRVTHTERPESGATGKVEEVRSFDGARWIEKWMYRADWKGPSGETWIGFIGERHLTKIEGGSDGDERD